MIVLFKKDYKSNNVSELEKLRFNEEEYYKKYDKTVLIQTCNRIECYFDCDGEDEINNLKNNFKDFEYIKDNEAIIHLLRLSSGLESMIVGEYQILGQIKNSYNTSKRYGKITKYLEVVFLKAIHTGQRVRKETNIGKGKISIGSAAVELAEKIFGLKDKNILLVGAGEMGTLVAKALMEKNIKAIVVANRTYERAEVLAKKLKGIAIKLDKLKEAINYSDVIICATGSPHYIIRKHHFDGIEGKKVIIDIANPRDVEEEVGKLSNITLYTIDDLKIISEDNLRKRMDEIPKVEKIIMEEYSLLVKQLNKLKYENNIKNYSKYIEEIRKKELNKALNMLKSGKNPEEVLIKFSEVFANRIIHDYVKDIYCEDRD